MREILFRGKRIDNGNWVEGVYFPENGREKATIFYGMGFCLGTEVIPETVGQYTGLCDKNGKKIFEGDIVKQTFEKNVAFATIDPWCEDEYADLYGEDVGVVVILPSKGACIKNPVIHRAVNGDTTQDGEVVKMYKNICQGRCEVIGTIHDNPELLEG